MSRRRAIALALISAGIGCTQEIPGPGPSGVPASSAAGSQGSGGVGASPCTATTEMSACDDGLFCTENDICMGGACVGGTPRFCATNDVCHIGVCDEPSKTCTTTPGNDGAPCDDKDPCTLAGTCSGGACLTGPKVDCSVFNDVCAVGACDPQTGCKPMPVNSGGPCDDGLFCTVNDFCQNAKCVSNTPNPCAPPGGCYIASCDEATDTCTMTPGNDGQPCDDADICTQHTTCLSGACKSGQPDNEGVICNDGNACTTGATCQGGACKGGMGPTVYFADDFHDNSKGWILGPEWQIGPAMGSVGGFYGADPETDHTPTQDDGVAGVAIGGNAITALHPYHTLESPPFDTASAAGPVILGFYRWLNSDYHPFMHNSIDVWNGVSWINVWTSGGAPGVRDSPPDGAGWTFIQHDLTAHKSAAMKIRFGFDIPSGGAFPMGSWNIDDVLVASAACP